MSSNIQVYRVCEHCKQDFIAKTTVTRYCTHKCNRAAYKLKLKEAKIERSHAETAAVKDKPLEDLTKKLFYTIDDLTQLFGISKRTFYRIIERGELPHAKLGGKTFVHKDTIEDLFKKGA
jgi:excisionase family DNA binding protein